jgi:hypothetical protein
MIDALPLLLGPEGYQISRSVRLRSSANAYFFRTFSANGTTNTLSLWIKRGKLGAAQSIFDTSNGVSASCGVFFNASDALEFYDYNVAYRLRLITTQVFRDPSAWYHIVCQINTTNATAASRAKVYVNGVEITSFSTATYPAQNTSLNIGSSQNFGIGVIGNITGQNFDGYLTETNFIDGQALTPSSFGETDAVTGVWKPKKYAGTYGTNGFYLNFSDNSAATAAAIGADYSGNGNNWTPNNISVTAGVTYDSMLDVPTQWADGGNGRGNYAVASPIDISGGVTSEANLRVSYSTAFTYFRGTISVNTGKYYLECLVASMGGAGMDIGFGGPDMALTGTSSRLQYRQDGSKVVDAAVTSYGATYTTSDVIGAAIDFDAGTCTFYKNNVSQGSISFTANRTFAPMGYMGASGSQQWNFGQRPFAFSPPTGFKALNTGNLPTPTILKGNQYFDATLWDGNSTNARVITSNVGTVDFAWVKKRNGADDHRLANTVTGGNKHLKSNATDAESTATTVIQAFSGSTFTVGTDNSVNVTGGTYVGWTWQAGGAAVTNTAGSISSQVSAGATQGFSVVTYTANGASSQTIGHGLGVAPAMIITKCRSAGSSNWGVYHRSLGNTGGVFLNTTNAFTTQVLLWNNTTPTSSVFTVGSNNTDTNFSTNTMVAYCFAAVAGFSAFGSYTGNNSTDGPFVFCGFRPRFVMVKSSSNAGTNWEIWDAERNNTNQMTNYLVPNSSAAEQSASFIDFLSNGFKIRSTQTEVNGSGYTMIFAAFAEVPFRNSLAR